MTTLIFFELWDEKTRSWVHWRGVEDSEGQVHNAVRTDDVGTPLLKGGQDE